MDLLGRLASIPALRTVGRPYPSPPEAFPRKPIPDLLRFAQTLFVCTWVSLFVSRLFVLVLLDNALFVPTMFGSHITHLVYSLPSPGERSLDLLSLDLLCQRDPSAGHLVESPLHCSVNLLVDQCHEFCENTAPADLCQVNK